MSKLVTSQFWNQQQHRRFSKVHDCTKAHIRHCSGHVYIIRLAAWLLRTSTVASRRKRQHAKQDGSVSCSNTFYSKDDTPGPTAAKHIHSSIPSTQPNHNTKHSNDNHPLPKHLPRFLPSTLALGLLLTLELCVGGVGDVTQHFLLCKTNTIFHNVLLFF